jgi:hypothetical protein
LPPRTGPQEVLDEIEGRRKSTLRSLSAIADGITARAVRLRAVEGGGRVLGEMEIGGAVECERDLLHLLSDGDLRLAENHEKMRRLVAECADALDGVAAAAAEGALAE